MLGKLSKIFFVLLLNCLYLTNCKTDHDQPEVHIDNYRFRATVVGKKFVGSGTEYMEFRGIPYAKPPINSLRFKDPQHLDKFEGTLDATHDGYECCSLSAENGSEDCLNLNVFTKQLYPSKLLPVLVLIHPGGLYLGSSVNFFKRPDHMMTQDLVLVTFNYRLGPFGFLNLGTPEIPGNAGFKDQVFALRWVQKFIRYFGGNPQDVTLMSYSAGSLSVQLHMMSPMSRELFHKAIMMSSSLPPQTYLPQGQQKYLAVRLAKRLKCAQFEETEEEIPYGVEGKFSDYENIKNEDILECLRQHNGTVIAGTLRPMFDFFRDNPIFLWLPVVERQFQQERFLTENFNVARKNLLVGYTNGELCVSSEDILDNDEFRERFSREFDTLAPRAFMYERHRNRSTITQKIKQKFLNGSTDFSRNHYDALCDIFSDSIVRYGSHKFAQFLSQNNGLVYFYEFSFVADRDKGSNGFPSGKDRCEHMMDFQYLFNWLGRNYHAVMERKMIKMYTEFMYDFIKNGKPTDPRAKPYPHAYAVINETIEYKMGHGFQNYDFWQETIPRYLNYDLK